MDQDLSDGRTFDAICLRLIVIGEAIKDLPPHVIADADEIPWADIARMRDRIAHRYFDTDHAIVAAVAGNRIPGLRDAVVRLLGV